MWIFVGQYKGAVNFKNYVMEAQIYQRKKRILALLFALLLLMEIFV
jgi:uncharacterized membrane protein